MTPVRAQILLWESLVPDPGATEPDDGWFNAQHVILVQDSSVVITGARKAGLGVGLSRVSIEGDVLWNQSIEDIDSIINPGIGDERSIYIAPILIRFDSEFQKIEFLGHQLITFSSTYGPVYRLTMSLEGDRIDTVAGVRDRVVSASLTDRWVQLRSGRYMRAAYFPYDFDSNAYSLYVDEVLSNLTYHRDSGTLRKYFYPGEQWANPQLHLPRDIVEADNGDILFWGSGGTVERTPYNIYRPFFLRLSSDGAKLSESNPALLYDGVGLAQKLSLTRDGGSVGTYVAPVAYTEDGNSAQNDAVVIRMDTAGRRIWETPFGREGRGFLLYRTRELPDGTFITCGFSYDFDAENPGHTVEESTQHFMARISSEGEVLWTHEWGDSGVDNSLRDLVVLPDGDVIVVGLQGSEMYVARVETATLSVEEWGVPDRLDLSDGR